MRSISKRDSRICELYKQGVIGPDIALRFGITRSRVYQILHRCGVPVKPNGWNLAREARSKSAPKTGAAA